MDLIAGLAGPHADLLIVTAVAAFAVSLMGSYALGQRRAVQLLLATQAAAAPAAQPDAATPDTAIPDHTAPVAAPAGALQPSPSESAGGRSDGDAAAAEAVVPPPVANDDEDIEGRSIDTFSNVEQYRAEREFMAHLKAQTGCGFSGWMRRIGEQCGSKTTKDKATRLRVVEWLQSEGFSHRWALWLMFAHERGGRPTFETEPEMPVKAFTFLPARHAAHLFCGFLRDVAAGKHPLCVEDDFDAPRVLLDLRVDRQMCVDWMTNDEVIAAYRGWCHLYGYVPVDRGALLAEMGSATGVTKERLFASAEQCERLRARHCGRHLPKRPTLVRVWSWREMAATGRTRQDEARRVATLAAAHMTGGDGKAEKLPKMAKKQAGGGRREASHMARAA